MSRTSKLEDEVFGHKYFGGHRGTSMRARIEELEETVSMLLRRLELVKHDHYTPAMRKKFLESTRVEKGGWSVEVERAEKQEPKPAKKHKKHNFPKTCPDCGKICKGNLGLAIHAATQHKTHDI